MRKWSLSCWSYWRWCWRRQVCWLLLISIDALGVDEDDGHDDDDGDELLRRCVTCLTLFLSDRHASPCHARMEECLSAAVSTQSLPVSSKKHKLQMLNASTNAECCAAGNKSSLAAWASWTSETVQTQALYTPKTLITFPIIAFLGFEKSQNSLRMSQIPWDWYCPVW